ncbi:uncharacterized protein LOC135100504 isoform X1 [Scylla paramamosain]|uniref:uncharacterized protein LOC135100504 isoform X1 n=1 Tax=Scylla paramamosain TaxID=85552 RepID=UPI00308344BE
MWQSHLIVLLILAGASAASRVYVLAPEGVPDNETRLALRLRDALSPNVPSTLHTFTLCLWFQVITFYPFNTILSYAVTGSPHTLVLVVRSSDLHVRYEEHFVRKIHPFLPLQWYAACVVMRPTGLRLWLVEESVLLEAAMFPLSLDGFLVLGQKQDRVDGGYTTSQAFSGHVTLFNLWDIAFSTQDLDDWSRCRPVVAEPLTDWDNLNIIHNGSAGIDIHAEGPCNNESLNHNKVLLVTQKMRWKRALHLMTSFRKWTDSRSFSFQHQHEALLRSSQSCNFLDTEQPVAWIGLLYNCSSKEIQKLNGVRANVTPNWSPNFTTIIHKTSCMDLRPVAVNADEYWYYLPDHIELCSFAEKCDSEPNFNIRMQCRHDEQMAYFYLNFIFTQAKATQHQDGAIYLHGVQPYVMEQTYNRGIWCLKKRTLPSPTVIACTNSSYVPLGFETWYPVPVADSEADPCTDMNLREFKSSFSSPLLMSTCSSEQFTCNDLQCITLDKVCDMKPDCKKGEDERDCSIIGSANGHLLNMPPSFPLHMQLLVTVKKISNIDLMNFAMTMTFAVLTIWRDPRLRYNHLLPGTRTVNASFESGLQIWRPALWLEDSLEIQKSLLEVLMVERRGAAQVVPGSHLEYKGSENPLWNIQDIQATFFCGYDLRSYPKDRQTCNLLIYVKNVNRIGLEIDAASRMNTCRQFLVEYHVVHCRLMWPNVTNNFTIQVTLLRRQEYFIFSTYLPSVLLLAIGYGTLHLPADLFNERGTMSLTTLLLFISLYTQTSSSLPKTSYMKYIDEWYVFSLSYLSLIIAIHMVTCSTALSTSMSEGAASVLKPRGLSIAVVPGGSGGGQCEVKMSLISDVNILKISRIAFAAIAAIFMLYYFTKV